MALLLGYGNQLDNNFYYGVNVKLIYSSSQVLRRALPQSTLVSYNIPDSRWNFGFSILNLGSQLKAITV